MRHSDPEGLYSALGVSPAADPDEIKNAYRRLAKATHPDTGDDCSHVGDEVRRIAVAAIGEDAQKMMPAQSHGHRIQSSR